MAADTLKLKNPKRAVLVIRLKAERLPVGIPAKSKDEKSSPKEVDRLKVKQDLGLVGDYWLP